MSEKPYKLTVGIEVHAELNTRTKMFCASKNDPDETRANHNVCPVCLGYPGTLPVINKDAVERILRFGLAVGGEIANYTEFDRKNYFYPDIPKGYQLSQYKYPLVKGGELAGVKLTRVHLEEDTARSSHPEDGHSKEDESLIDFNRAGVPLMELVTEPVISSPEEAGRFAKELQLLLVTLGISEANMEKGEMRVEANISISNSDKLGTKVEVKNLNSFRAVEKAIRYEMERQQRLLEAGEEVKQETLGWDDAKGETYSQRAKEDSHDYRYFPEPDLPKLFINEIWNLDELRTSLPELPWQKRERLSALGLSPEHVEIYVSDFERGEYFESVSRLLSNNPKAIVLASNYITSELKTLIEVREFISVIEMLINDEISSRGAKEILKIISENGGIAREIAVSNNLMQVSDENILRAWLEEAVKENGREVPSQFLIGQAMKKSGGRANPILLQKILEDILRS